MVSLKARQWVVAAGLDYIATGVARSSAATAVVERSLAGVSEPASYNAGSSAQCALSGGTDSRRLRRVLCRGPWACPGLHMLYRVPVASSVRAREWCMSAPELAVSAGLEEDAVASRVLAIAECDDY